MSTTKAGALSSAVGVASEFASAPYGDDATAGSGYLATTWGNVEHYTETLYDALGRPTDVITRSTGTEKWRAETSYGTATGVTTVTAEDELDHATTYHYNGYGELVTVTEANGAVTTYQYTHRGELEEVTDDDGNQTKVFWDLMGRKTKIIDPDMGTWTYGYDDAGNLTTQTDARGTTLTFTYDAANRLDQRKQGSMVLADYDYDGAFRGEGLLWKAIVSTDTAEENMVVVDRYDEMGRTLKQTQTLWGVEYITEFTYTPGGLVETIKYPKADGEINRETVTYTYDDAGRHYSLVGTRGSFTWTYVDAAGYNAWGAPEIWDLGGTGDINRNWVYSNNTRRVSQIRGGTSQLGSGGQVNVMRHRYETYDLSGNVTELRDSRNSDQYQCFSYDTMDRLTDAYTGDDCVGGPDATGDGAFDHYGPADGYDYSRIGNITDLSGTAYTYAQSGNAGPHAPTGVGSVAFTYDPNGNRLTATDGSDVTTYGYDPDNRMTSIDLPNTTDDLVFVYDTDGQRVRRSAGTDRTVYVGGLMEVDLDDTMVTETRTHYSFGGLPVAVRTHEADETTFLFTDHLGTVTSTWNDTTDTLTLTRYFPYGGERHSSGEMPQDQRYTGQTSDATTNASGGSGLLYYNARYYDPATAQFTQPDTIVPARSDPAGLNRYSYVRGNPLKFADPSGHCWDPTIDPRCDVARAPTPVVGDPALAVVGGTGEGYDEDAMQRTADNISRGAPSIGTAGPVLWDAPTNIGTSLGHLEFCDESPVACPLKGSGNQLAEGLTQFAKESRNAWSRGVVAHSQGVAALSFAFHDNRELWDLYDYVVLVAGSASDVNAFRGYIKSGGVVVLAYDPTDLIVINSLRYERWELWSFLGSPLGISGARHEVFLGAGHNGMLTPGDDEYLRFVAMIEELAQQP
jgi:RHS repeat-associated protein